MCDNIKSKNKGEITLDRWIEVSIKVNHEAVEAVADVFAEAGARNGVVIDDPVRINDLRNSRTWDITDIPEQENTEMVTITAYYPDDEKMSSRLEFIEKALTDIESRIGAFRFGSMLFRTVSEEDWANNWKQYFHVTRIGKNIVIKPTWEEYQPVATDLVIELDPGMAFGTGTHHTTTLCMEALEDVVRSDSTIFDVGTGSGVLAIVAAKLGAQNIKAVDIDTTAVKVAKENIIQNNLADKIEVAEGDLIHGTEGQADVIIANIIADIIIMLLPDIPGKLKADGVFLASGIIDSRKEDVIKEAEEVGLKVDKVFERGGWVALQMTKG